MDVILAHFSAAELRVKCLRAVHDELQHAETQLQPALDALKRALSVVHASRTMYKAPLVFVDESPDVSTALGQLVAACNEMGALVCALNREVSSAGASDVSSSATDEEEDQNRQAEPKTGAVVGVEKKKAAKDTGRSVARANKASGPIETAAVVDLSLSEEEPAAVKDEPRTETTDVQEEMATVDMEMATFAPDEERSWSASAKDVATAAGEEDHSVSVDTLGNDKEDDAKVAEPPSRRKLRKRKAPSRIAPPVAKRPVRDVVVRLRKRAEMAPSGAVGVAVCSALNAAVSVEETHPETTGVNPRIGAFVSATAEAGKMLVEVHAEHPVQAERHLEDMRLLMSVAVVNLERELSVEVVAVAWKMLKALQQLHDLYPLKTRGLHRNCRQLCKYLVKEHEVPADVVKEFKAMLGKVFVEVDDWIPLDGLTTKWFDKHMNLVNELLDSRFERWNPRTKPILGKTVSKLERICTFGVGDAWNDRYASICLACSKMSRTTFFWTVNLADEMTEKLIRCNQLEPGFEDKERVKLDFEHVTTYDLEVRDASSPNEKKAAFDELIDRLRWIFNAVAMTRDQSLVSLPRLKRLNECFSTLARLCDNGGALNLEGCLHLEKLLAVMRQVMYIRTDYAGVSKRAKIENEKETIVRPPAVRTFEAFSNKPWKKMFGQLETSVASALFNEAACLERRIALKWFDDGS
ncbi:hypothetical protein PHYPSEUDO_004646 [Phytophthora pseudosyringae]|uniref:Uncharacterized protein n=1 Tax=Phytophthora pseudosyringae TaxID=221518 RepID=A0A8T1VP37_9STRA|nr:hypothetical protein PHYPSEUDO_004646 [Phytophthora pseudosyringae]